MVINYILPLLGAVIGWISSPGNGLGFFAFLIFVPLLFAIKDGKRVYLKTLLFSVPYYFYNFIWINTSVSRYGNAPLIVGLICVLGMSVYMSLYLVIFVRFSRNTNNIWILAGIFTGLEMLRGTLFTGFPWLNVGSLIYEYDWSTIIYKNLGEYGATFLLMLCNISIFQAVSQRRCRCAFPFILVMILVSAGILIKDEKSDGSQIKVSIVQPSYSQEEKWLPEKKEEIKADVINKTGEALATDSDIIFLSESVFPFFIQNDNASFNYFLESSKLKTIVFGNVRYDYDYRYYNSAFFFENGHFDYYDKIRLVPFGEYFPLKIITRPISRYFFGDADDFKMGKQSKIFETKNGIKILPVICYESAFFHLFENAFKLKIPDIIAVLSNDSWFGGKIGRMQHLALDAVRAKEFSKPVVRATQSGISACISGDGTVIKSMGIGETGVLNCSLTTDSEITTFARYGYTWVYVYLLGILFHLAYVKLKSKLKV